MESYEMCTTKNLTYINYDTTMNQHYEQKMF